MSSNDVVAILLLFVTMLFWGATPLLEKLGLKEVEPLTGILIRSGVTITIILLALTRSMLEFSIHEYLMNAKISSIKIIL